MEYLDLDGGHYSFFGGAMWNERSRAYAKPDVPQVVINKLFELAPAPCYLHSMVEDVGKAIPIARPEMETYYLNGAELNWDYENLLLRMSHETRKSVKRGFRTIEEMQPEFSMQNFNDIPDMIELNKSRFGHDSTFCKPFFEDSINTLVASPLIRPYLRVISIRFHGELKSCALCGWYNGVYIYLASGSDDTIQNMPKYLIYRLIMDAFSLKAVQIYMLSFDCGWKDRWHVDKKMLYVVEKE
jgi:hypothetical protein